MPSLNEYLIRAIIKGDTAAVESLLAQGADANTTGGVTALGASNTALMWAATEGYFDIVELLLVHNADVNAKNPADYTALMFAAESDRRNIVLLLLDRGASICGRNPYGETVLMTMARRGQTDIVQRLVKMGAQVNPQ